MMGVPGGHPPPPAPPGGPCESRTAETEAFMTDNIIKEGKRNAQLPRMFLGMRRNMGSVKPKVYLSARFARYHH